MRNLRKLENLGDFDPFQKFVWNSGNFSSKLVRYGQILRQMSEIWNFENKTVKMRKCLTKFGWIFECEKFVNIVDLVKSLFSFISLFPIRSFIPMTVRCSTGVTWTCTSILLLFSLFHFSQSLFTLGSFIPTSIYLQRFVSIQPRMSLSKFAKKSPNVRKNRTIIG